MILQGNISDRITLLKMLSAAAGLESFLRSCSECAVSPQLRDELQKQTAEAACQTSVIREILSDEQ